MAADVVDRWFGDLDRYLLGEGSHLRPWQRLGAHCVDDGVLFAVWAPNARAAAVVGDFNGWNDTLHPLRPVGSTGVWACHVPGAGPGSTYKFALWAQDGSRLPLKADPYARRAEHPPQTASIVVANPAHEWADEAWMSTREAAVGTSAPVSIYEVHLGSWRRKHDDDGRFLSYLELADELVAYVADMGFTHVELLPITEFPFDGSWGYQPVGLYAPTIRFGTPDEFRALVDRFHAAGIGVLIDWVPAHFPTDAHGLGRFDGTCLYEHEDTRKGFHRDWNTLIFNYGRTEVANYLLGNALYWTEQFHIDGLRVDAVASMLYLDYSRDEGEWLPNEHGGNENLEAVAFLRRMNEQVYAECPGVTTMAEESTAWPGVTQMTSSGGLGFGYKWNMGWMHDTLEYMQREPVYRRYHHHEMTFGLHYGFSENFVLPLSHDEVVHGKRSLLGKMPGDMWQKFANLRAYFAFMWTHPGKKLLFMGGEFGQRHEWNHDTELDWGALNDPMHLGVQKLVRDLNALYRELPALHQLDASPDGFQWIEANAADESLYVYLRRPADEDAREVVVVANFTPVVREACSIGLPRAGRWEERLNTDAEVYGGSGVGNLGGVDATEVPWHGWPASAAIGVPPLGAVVLVGPRVSA